MVLPLLLGLGLPALAASSAAPTFLATMASTLGPVGMGALGSGLGSFIQSGDIGEGIQTGLTSFLGGKLLGGLTGGNPEAPKIDTANFGELPQAGFLQAAPSLTDTGGLFASEGMKQAAAGAFAPGVMPSAYIGSTMAGISADERAAKKAAKEREDSKVRVPLPNPMRRTYNPTPYYNGGGEGTFFQYQRPPRSDGSEVEYPYTYADGGKLGMSAIADKAMELFGDVSESSIGKVMRMLNPMSGGIAALMGASGEDMPEGVRKLGRGLQRVGSYTLPPYALKGMGYDRAADVMGYPFDDEGELRPQYKAEGGEMQADEIMAENGMNEKDVIVDAIEAIKGMSEQPEIVLALFVQKYGEEALRDLVGRVQSGELDDTVERFAEGDKGMVRGPGDGSGVDDMVPATLEGEQDVLLSDGEFVLREKTTDALEKAYGGGFLDVINRAEEEAPRKLQQMVG